MEENDDAEVDQHLTGDNEEIRNGEEENSGTSGDSSPEDSSQRPPLCYIPTSSSVVKLPNTSLVATVYIDSLESGVSQPVPGHAFGSEESMFSKQTWSENGSNLLPFCRICLMPDEEGLLFSPCRCTGSLTYVHQRCIKKWMNVLSRKKKTKQLRCEICQYKFRWSSHFKWKHWRFPRISHQDKILHSIFLFFLFVIIGCVVWLALCGIYDTQRKRDKESSQAGQGLTTPLEIKKNENKTVVATPSFERLNEIRTNDIVTISCAILFIFSTLVCWVVEWNAKHSVIKLYKRFRRRNKEWIVEPYDSLYDDIDDDK
ncbi:hypothetical protein CHS0354_009654 [Potamilus streckersoni]|uniref:RING-CH-type domain-containing protein n=1 Tax=Potamilus streckersoni TaxID=2493646 RepID=A0AAE0S4U0_9BIVA|nr:hypothetical protein CHS0354_009654 [Potamilus streckersoni]